MRLRDLFENDLPKKRDPNWKTLQAKRTSGAAGVHRDKKKEQKQGYKKHKSKSTEESQDGTQ